MQDRQFSTGSIEAPDPFDKHLDQLGFYRKHTARDATCLFRVISEQLYDAQIYHLDVRDTCVRYMAMKPSVYEWVTNGTSLTYDDYLAKMSKNRTFGTLAELTVLAHRFERNVFMFKVCNMGDWFVYEKEFKDTFLVFYTPPKHFDTVYVKSYIESVAFCQSLTYEILYSHVFRLPDVIYAVERMLHDPPEGTHISQIEVSPYDESQESLTLTDGRHFILDHADETECILKNYLFCHFHNKQFEKMIALYDFSLLKPGDPVAWMLSEQAFAASLPRRNVSCVRQLLDDNIKPFSYKVAKALDRYIYRNIEFDVWSDARKNARFKQWSQGDTLQVGIKCLVDDIDPTEKSSYCHIQEMHPQKNSCVVFVEKMGENRTVPMKAIKTIPSISWIVPNHSSRNNRLDKKRKRSNNNWRSNVLYKYDSNSKYSKIDDDVGADYRYFTKTMHIPQQYCEYITQPQYSSNNRYLKTSDETSGGNNQSNNKNGPAKKGNQNQSSGMGVGEKLMKAESNKNVPAKRSGATTDTKSGKADILNVEFEPHVHYGHQTSMGYVDTSNTVTFTQMERTDVEGSPMQNYGGHHSFMPLQSMIQNTELLLSIYPPNINAQPSVYADGSDLQRIDFPTLRFFYNLGHEYMRYMHYRFPPKAVTAMFQGIISDAFQSRPNRYSGGYYDNFNDIGELANDFSRSVSFAGRDQQHANKPNEGQSQYRRTFNANTVNAPKKSTRNYRVEFKGKRQFVDAEPTSSKNHQQQQQQLQQNNYSKTPTDYSDSTSDPSARSTEFEPVLMTTPHMYSYHEAVDPSNVYGVPVGYGMYPNVNDNFATYPMPVSSGVMFSEPLNVDSDLTQTYPYYNPQGTYYYSTPMPQIQIGQPHQGSWYPPSIIPMQVPLELGQPSGRGSSTVSLAAPSTPSYGSYVGPDQESAPFTPNEQ